MDDEIVWLFEQRRYALLVSRHAYYSVVKYVEHGLDIEIEVMNDDYEFWDERATGIEYDTD
jgi:hypothetical protein